MWSWPYLQEFLAAHGTALILPLAVVEGPVVSIAAGFLAARGYFDWYWALALLVAGDLIGDSLYYAIGRFSRTPLERLGRRLGLSAARSAELQRGLLRDSLKMLLLGKWTHAIGGFVLLGAGALRLKLPRFLLVNLLATLPKSAVLLAAGYVAGNDFPFLARHADLGLAGLLGLGLAGLALILRGRRGLWHSGAGR